MKTRQGWSYTVKFEMWTASIKDKDEDFCFNKVEGFVSFESNPFLRIEQLKRQIKHKVEFYEKLYKIEVVDYAFKILADMEVEFLPLTPQMKEANQ